MKQYILITGGAGYIGSHIVHELIHHGYQVIVFDRVATQPVIHERVTYCVGDLADKQSVAYIFKQYAITAVVHCAGSIEVGASITNPHEYYTNNVVTTLNLLHCMREHTVLKIIFSSTAAVYGTPRVVPIPEDHPLQPLSPYGTTKYIIEQILKEYAHAYGVRYVTLRYFNAAGATPEVLLGERHEPETHLIPRLLHAAYTQEPFTLWGTDYPTPDGTCVRDYIHVRDIACAHRKALEYLGSGLTVNLGTMEGHSVQEIITLTQEITQQPIHLKKGSRRPGDPAELIADARYAYRALGWQPTVSDIHSIIYSAWQFYLHTRSVDSTKPSIVKLMHTQSN